LNAAIIANKISFNIFITNSIHVCRSDAPIPLDLTKSAIQYGFKYSMTQRQRFYVI
jgi:hypothetical protein